MRGRAMTVIAVPFDRGRRRPPAFRGATATLAREALPFARAAQGARATCWCLRIMTLGQMRNAPAATLAAQALALARADGDPGTLVVALETPMFVAETFDEAQRLFEEAAGLLREMGDQILTGVLLSNVGWMAMTAEEDDFASAVLDEALQLTRSIGHLRALTHALANRGLPLLQGQVDQARRTLLRSFAALQRHGAAGSRVGIAVRAERARRTRPATRARGDAFWASAAIRGSEPLAAPNRVCGIANSNRFAMKGRIRVGPTTGAEAPRSIASRRSPWA